MVATAVTAKACARLAGAKVSRMIDCWLGCRPPPKNPCARRHRISCGKLCDRPQSNENSVNIPMQIRK
jgi:hypothetical protein